MSNFMATGTKTKRDEVYHVQVLDRAFRILDILAESGSGIWADGGCGTTRSA